MILRAVAAALALTALWPHTAVAAKAAGASAAPPVALAHLAERLAQDLERAGAQPPLGIWVQGESDELARAFATLLASQLAQRQLAPIPVEAPTAAQAEATARERGARSLARLTVGLGNGLLQARGDLVGTWVNFWSGRTPTRAFGPAAGLEGSTDADAHALALAATPLTQPVADAPQTGEVRMLGGVFARLGSWTAALAAGDLDGDGKDEVVALTDDEVLAFGPEGQLIARRDHKSALPAAAAPSREPFGAIAVLSAPARVAYVSGKRARGEVLALEGRRAGFRVLGPTEEAPLGSTGSAVLTGKLVAGQNVFAQEIRHGAQPPLKLPSTFTAASVFTGPSGAELLVVAPDGTGTFRAGLGGTPAPEVVLQGLGAATALADVDGDGASEIITTEPAFRPEPEALRVLRSATLSAGGEEAQVRFRKELPRGRALQVVGANLDGDLAEELIVAVWMPDGTTELWVFRRAR